MNLLLVDDEEYVIQSIKKHIDLKYCGIDEVYTAFSMKQAQEVMKLMSVDVIISDIVMPERSGFDFIEWVREKAYEVQVIFLTSYAEFDYARRAISLDSVDYQLKPIDYVKLELALKNAIYRATELKKYKRYQNDSSHWKKNSQAIQRDFWQQVLQKHISEDQFLKEGMIRGITYEDAQQFLLMVFSFSKEKRGYEQWEEKTLLFLIENVLTEMLEETEICFETVFLAEHNHYAVLCTKKRKEKLYEKDLQNLDTIERFVYWVNENTGLDVWCGMGKMCFGTQLPEMFDEIRVMRGNSLSIWNRVLYLSDFKHPTEMTGNPHLSLWETLIEERKKEELLDSMEAYLTEMEGKEMITRSMLKAFRMDVIQIVYSWLASKEIKAHLLFSTQESDLYYQNALEGLHEALVFGKDFVEKALEYEKQVNKTTSVSEKIKNYIDLHYREEIRRNDLAELVYLNTDYMSRIFKKEMGISLSNYIIQKRVDAAKKLLSESNLPINTISLYSGYTNFSYFTKMFKENTGYSPLEYRRAYLYKKKG